MSDPMAHGALGNDTTIDLAVPAVALAVGAHPDDVEFGCGGTLAKWAAAGSRIHHLVCTDGSKGTWDPEMDATELVGIRQAEQKEASRRLGGDGAVTFLGWTDGELESGLRQRWEVAYWIRKIRPDVILGHDPWRRYRLHPDHRHAGFLVTDGIVAARDPLFFPEQGKASHRPSALLLWEADQPDHLENIDGFEDQKLHALMAHRSQFRSTMGVSEESEEASSEMESFRQRVHARHSEAGRPLGLPAAEAFKLIQHL